jgi:hypothetical protein
MEQPSDGDRQPTRRALRILAFLGAAVVALAAASAQAGTEPDPPEWEFEFTPYLWASQINGSAGTNRVSTDLDIPFKDILSDLDFGLMGTLEARKGRFLVLIDGVGVLLGTEEEFDGRTIPVGAPILGAMATVGPSEIDVDLGMLVLDSKVGWTALSHPMVELFGGKQDERRVELELLAGFRYWYLDVEVDVDIPISLSGPALPGSRLPPGTIGNLVLPEATLRGVDATFDGSQSWLDPLIGFRVRADLTRDLVLEVQADIGGFDIGSASKHTWQGIAALDYRISDTWGLRLGYRFLRVEREGSRVSVDMRMHGLVLGLAYSF